MTRQRRKDEVFYITTVVFLVEDTLFRLPRGPFVDQSAFFRQRILQRAPEIVKPGGSSDDVPFHLESIEKDDFKQLLKVLFPPRPVNATDAPQTYSEWAAVLKLSTKWGFENARQQAIDQMESMSIDPIDKICLARDYDVDEWLAPAVNDLVKREEPINVNDVDRLGLEFALKVAAIRERVANHPSASLQIGDRQVEHLDFTSSVAAMLVSIDMAS
ncbi:hypothetical protein BJ138DRAFT_1014582 [Hygrophoropsis aurantiaca]|uniref:Uncharacterized protein n=1 Tax=Hygrophoropsis aurantiaca TaxID=72124 RepID=A0ACB8A3Z0_9AGAM|nr:hypothetical protein BJ138DRAFT_1014582 [Hygrophoropsis aurantiaca]